MIGMLERMQGQLCLHPLPADPERREREIERVCREGYRLLETWREPDGTWFGRFVAPSRPA
jgi:hypothetical protein